MIKLGRYKVSFIQSLAAVILILIILTAIFADFLAPSDPITQDVENRFAPIGAPGFMLGSDYLGRDILSRLIHGAQTELLLAFGATFIAFLLGILIGITAGYFRGVVEVVLMRSVDVLLSFPAIIVALLITAIIGQSNVTLILVMGVLFAPMFARISYSQSISISTLDYVSAARVFKAPRREILFSIILKNIMGPLMAQFSLTVAAAILLASGLSYLGLGVVPPEPSWGQMIAEAQRNMSTHPSTVLIPGAVVTLIVLAFGIVGDMIRDWMNPKHDLS